MNDEELTLAGIGLTIILIITTLVGYTLTKYFSCHKKAEMQGLECEWSPLQGCMVKMPRGNWMDYDRLRYMK